MTFQKYDIKNECQIKVKKVWVKMWIFYKTILEVCEIVDCIFLENLKLAFNLKVYNEGIWIL